MHLRRKVLSLTLGLILILASVAGAAPGDAVLFETENGYSEISIEGAVALGDTLYLASWNDLYTYKLGDEEPVKLVALQEEYEGEVVKDAEPVPVDSIEGAVAEEPEANEYNWRDRLSIPFVFDGKLYMINGSTMALWELQGEEFVETELKIDKPSAGEDYDVSNFYSAIHEAEGTLYALVRTDMENWDAPQELWALDLKSGTHTVVQTEYPVKGFCPYKPGALLCWTQPEYGTMGTDANEDAYYARMFVLDIATGKAVSEPVVVSKQTWGGIGGPVYSAERDMIYYGEQNKLTRRQSLESEPEVISYFTRDMQNVWGTGMLGPDHVFFRTYEGTYIRNIDEVSETGAPLRIANEYMSEVASAFMKANPDIPLEFVEVDSLYGATADEIAQKIGSGEADVDIYTLYDGDVLRKLMEKGYVYDLSGSEKLKAAYERMYAPIREALMVDGKYVAFPRYVYPDLWMYNAEQFEKLGLTFPETYSELLDLYTRWDEQIKVENPKVNIFQPYNMNSESDTKLQFFYMALYQYINEFSVEGEPIKFNTPEFLEVMQKIEALPGEMNNENSMQSYVYEYDEESIVLIEQYFQFEVYGGNGGADVPIYAPRISATTEPTAGISLSLYFVNPNSENTEAAIKYLEYMAENGEHSMMLSIYSDFNEPYKDPWADQNLKDAEEQLENAKKMEVTEAEQREKDERIKDAEQWVERAKQDLWRIPAERIELYREFADKGVSVTKSTSLFGRGTASKEITDLLQRYMDGQMDLNQMVRELDQKMQMIFLEQQ